MAVISLALIAMMMMMARGPDSQGYNSRSSSRLQIAEADANAAQKSAKQDEAWPGWVWFGLGPGACEVENRIGTRTAEQGLDLSGRRKVREARIGFFLQRSARRLVL